MLDENPEIENILDVDTMRELNGRVDIEQEDPEDVTEGFLRDQGLI